MSIDPNAEMKKYWAYLDEVEAKTKALEPAWAERISQEFPGTILVQHPKVSASLWFGTANETWGWNATDPDSQMDLGNGESPLPDDAPPYQVAAYIVSVVHAFKLPRAGRGEIRGLVIGSAVTVDDMIRQAESYVGIDAVPGFEPDPDGGKDYVNEEKFLALCAWNPEWAGDPDEWTTWKDLEVVPQIDALRDADIQYFVTAWDRQAPWWVSNDRTHWFEASEISWTHCRGKITADK